MGREWMRAVRRRLVQAGVWMVLLLGLALPACAAEDNYYYPDYDAGRYGCVDLMNYMKEITVSVNGDSRNYTAGELAQLEAAGQTLTQGLGSTISFNFVFSLQGRAYDADDPTRLDENASVKTTYTHGTTYLNGRSVAAGAEGILDDSSLMKVNTARGQSFLRMDIGWLQEAFPGDYTIEYTDGRVSFYQGTGSDSRYLYVYFPNGIGSDLYANTGYFSITTTHTKTTHHIHIPLLTSTPYFVQTDDGWDFCIDVVDSAQSYTGSITTYGDITVKKNWITNDAEHGPARIVLSYTEGGVQKTAVRELSRQGETATFTIQEGMTDCVISEDMTGLEGYTSQMEVSADGRTYTFTNTLGLPLAFSKRTVTGTEELPGAQLELYGVWNDGTESLIDRWTSGTEPHTVTLYPASYRLHEVSAPAGYAVTTDITFTIDNSYNVRLTGTAGLLSEEGLVVTDRELTVKLAKVDENGQPLPGASLRLTDSTTGKTVESWVSGSEPHTITYRGDTGEILVAGHTYTLTEDAAPDGYVTAAAITFVFNGDGTIPHCPYYTVTMQDQPAATPTPSPTPESPATPTPPAVTPTPSDSTPDNPMTGVPTGDSLLMWVFLALGVLSLLGAAATGFLWGRSTHTGR